MSKCHIGFKQRTTHAADRSRTCSHRLLVVISGTGIGIAVVVKQR